MKQVFFAVMLVFAIPRIAAAQDGVMDRLKAVEAGNAALSADMAQVKADVRTIKSDVLAIKKAIDAGPVSAPFVNPTLPAGACGINGCGMTPTAAQAQMGYIYTPMMGNGSGVGARTGLFKGGLRARIQSRRAGGGGGCG